jgi:hypothetical protein
MMLAGLCSGVVVEAGLGSPRGNETGKAAHFHTSNLSDRIMDFHESSLSFVGASKWELKIMREVVPVLRTHLH